MKRFLLFFITLPSLSYAQILFSSDSALSYLRTISVTIGARPMGSPNERRAMEFALAKFREFGLDEAYVMEMKTAKNDMTGASVNTSSGIAIGVLRGKTDRIIVIGGHIDSAGPDIPGANDDGSGSAAVIELARVLSKEQHHSTIFFCLFGGEEEGLIGSKYFVDHFSRIDSVTLMLELDMANGRDPLIPTIDYKGGNTPVWLVQATYEEFGKLGYSGLDYPTHFFTAMSMMPGGGVGSDHEPFLAKGIPAIDFTSDISDPIHTPQDDFEHFKPSGLKRSGDLVYALIHRFDENVPEEKTNNYYLLQIGKRALFFPLWLLSTFIIVSVVLAIGALIVVRKRRIETERSQRPKVPAFKLFLFALLIQTCVWLSENLVGLIKGTRFPWVASPDGYFILGFLAALLGIIFSLKFSRRVNLSKDPYRWFLRTVVFLLVFISLLALINVKVTLYPALALFFLALAMLANKPLLKLFFWILSPHFMFRLMFSEEFFFLGRTMALQSAQPMWMYFVLHLFYILFFALWSFPFLLGFAAVYFDSGIDLLWLKKWRTRTGLIVGSALFLLCVLVLSFLPSYSDEWRPTITIDQLLDMNTGKGTVQLKSSEYLRHLTVHLAEKDTTISTWERDVPVKDFTYHQAPWIQIERTVLTSVDSSITYDILATLHFKYRPRNFTLSYSAGKNKLEDVAGEFVSSSTAHSVSMRWKSFPDTVMMVPIHFRVVKADSVTETIEAKFIEMMEPVRIEKEMTNIFPQTTLRRTEIIRAGEIQ
ncbi:MAG: M28 family metallopeptidase [Bacteroidota bacterium]